MDRTFLVTALPEIPNRIEPCLNCILKPGGVLSITEEFLDPDYPLARTAIRWAREAGFELAEQHGNWLGYTRNFQKPTSQGAASLRDRGSTSWTSGCKPFSM